MNKVLKKYQNYFIPLVLILIVSFSRLIPHPYNFTPLLATGIFAGFYFKQFYLSLFIVIFSMFIGDLFLGFHSTMFFTYVALIVPVLFGIYAKHLKIYSILTSSVISSISFFIITNFGAWLTLDMYEKSFAGLINSYVMAIPFFHNTIISSLFYLFLFKFLFDVLINKKKIFKSFI